MSRNAEVEGIRVSVQDANVTLKAAVVAWVSATRWRSQGGFYVRTKMAF
jgi:hypothetical protein